MKRHLSAFLAVSLLGLAPSAPAQPEADAAAVNARATLTTGVPAVNARLADSRWGQAPDTFSAPTNGPDAVVTGPYYAWRMSGDDGIIRRNWAAMKALAASDAANAPGADDVLERYLAACRKLHETKLMAEMARQLGEDDFADACFDRADAQSDELKAKFCEKDGQLPKALRTRPVAAMWALKLDLVEDAREKTLAALKKSVLARGARLPEGALEMRLLLETLTEAEAPEVAYALLLKGGFAPAADGAALDWLYGAAAGIQPGPKGGFDEMVELMPSPDKRLGSVEATYRNSHGVITSAWRYDAKGRCHWTFSVPEGTRATVCVNGMCRPYRSGRYELEIK